MVTLQSTEMFFPSFLWRFELDAEEREAVHNCTLSVLDRLTSGLPALKPGQHRQTDGALHLVPDMEPFVQSIGHAVGQVLDFLDVIFDEAHITGCWANVNAVDANHREHTHPNNYLSGVYYIQADEGADSFTIHDPRAQRAVIRPRVMESTPFNGSEFGLNVKPGDLLVFPAWLPHSVGYNNSGRERISVSFNAMFDDFTRTMSPPEWAGELSTQSLRGVEEPSSS
ncbi:MAG: TIGR02466 family protein [Hyphomicrobiaceae bacterium]